MSLALSGCAIHYYDQDTGTEHLWGFGHLKMRMSPANEGVRATVKGVRTLGVGLGVGTEEYYLSAGWDNRRKIVAADDTSVRIEWPTSSFFSVRVGTNFPPAPGWIQQKQNQPEESAP